MSEIIRRVQVFAGTVEAASPEFRGMRAPATMTLIELETEYRCKFIFFAEGPLTLTVHTPKSDVWDLKGVAQDPRGWEVAFEVELEDGHISRSYKQPHD